MLFGVTALATVSWLVLAVHFARAFLCHRHPVALAITGHAFTMGAFSPLIYRARAEFVREVLPFAGGLSLLAALLILAAVVTSKLRNTEGSCSRCGSRSWLY